MDLKQLPDQLMRNRHTSYPWIVVRNLLELTGRIRVEMMRRFLALKDS